MSVGPFAPAAGAMAPAPTFTAPPAPAPQGFGVGGFQGDLGQNAQLGWGTAPPMQYPVATSGISTAVTKSIPAKKRKPASSGPQRPPDVPMGSHVTGAGKTPGGPSRPPDRSRSSSGLARMFTPGSGAGVSGGHYRPNNKWPTPAQIEQMFHNKKAIYY